MVKIIINADDLGKDHKTNLAIEGALRNGCITSSTIMANSTTWDEVHRVVEANPNASFGVHLNLTEGVALTVSEVLRKNGIVDDNNCFTEKSRKLIEINRDLESAIYEEWNAQVNKIINEEGINATHFDGHHHIHMNPAYTEVLKHLAKKYKIGYIRRKHNSWMPRTPREIFLQALTNYVRVIPLVKKIMGSLSNAMKQRMANSIWSKELSTVVAFSDYFNGYEQAMGFIRKGYKPKENTVIELMCHPGHPSFVAEFNLVEKHEIENMINGVKLCSYKILKRDESTN